MKKKVMVVDDSHMIELKICRLLEGSAFEVTAYCENGEDAIARYGEVQPDVVAMDIIMPGIDGLETAQIILEEHPEARVVMMSSKNARHSSSVFSVSIARISRRGFCWSKMLFILLSPYFSSIM